MSKVKAMRIPTWSRFECFNPMFHNLPAYLKATQYKRPTDPAWSAFSYAKHFDGSFFDYVQMHGRMAAAFDGTMQGYTVYRGSWVDSYPVDELVKGASEGQTLVVDIGGSTVCLFLTFICSTLTANP